LAVGRRQIVEKANCIFVNTRLLFLVVSKQINRL
jgi:hypothetical protein